MSEPPVNLSERLDALAAIITGTPAADLSELGIVLSALRGDVSGAVTALRGPQLGDLGDLVTAAANQRDDLADALFTQTTPARWPYLLNIRDDISDVKDTLGMRGEGMTVYALLDNIYMLLSSINQGITYLAGGTPPATVDRQYTSAGVSTVNTEGGYRTYALWPDAPFGTSTDATRINITASSGWAGWRAYVQTDSASPWMLDSPVAPQTWYALGGTGARNWSVEAGRKISVYLQGPNTEYTQIAPVLVNGYYRGEWPSAWRGGALPVHILVLSATQSVDLYGAHSYGQAYAITNAGNVNVPRDGSVITINGPQAGLQVVREQSVGPYYFYARLRG